MTNNVPKKVRRLGPFWFLCPVLAIFLESWWLYPRNVYKRFDWNGPCSIDQILLRYYLSQVGFMYTMDRQWCPRERLFGKTPKGVYRGLLSKASFTWKDSSNPCKPTSGVFPMGLSLVHHWRFIVYKNTWAPERLGTCDLGAISLLLIFHLPYSRNFRLSPHQILRPSGAHTIERIRQVWTSTRN